MIVYRVEDETGTGPYVQDACMTGVAGAHNVGDRWPAPTTDFDDFWTWMNIESNVRRFGFGSLEQLIWWFKGFHMELDFNGFFVTAYEVEDSAVVYGNKQVVFDISKATVAPSCPGFDWTWDMGPHEKIISQWQGWGRTEAEDEYDDGYGRCDCGCED